MLKTRLIPVLFLKNGLIVRSETFSYHQDLGNVVDETHRYNQWNIDELVFIDISEDNYYDLRRDDHKIKSKNCIYDLIDQISSVSFMPLTFGGGIRTLDDIRLRLQRGADKITINTKAYQDRSFVTEASKKFGSQCIVASIDYRIIDKRAYVFIEHGKTNTKTLLFDWAKQVEELGVGEIFLNSIDRDGMAEGYDIETIRDAANAVGLPVVACGGAGEFFDFVELVKETDISGIAAGNIFHFTEQSYPRAKEYLLQNNINVRK